MATRVPRRRERPEQPRTRTLQLTYNDAELAIVREAAGRAGMAVSSWAARAALDVAAEVVVPISPAARGVLEELVRARLHLARAGTSLQTALDRGPQIPADELAGALRAAAQAISRIDQAAVQVMRERRPRR